MYRWAGCGFQDLDTWTGFSPFSVLIVQGVFLDQKKMKVGNKQSTCACIVPTTFCAQNKRIQVSSVKQGHGLKTLAAHLYRNFPWVLPPSFLGAQFLEFNPRF